MKSALAGRSDRDGAIAYARRNNERVYQDQASGLYYTGAGKIESGAPVVSRLRRVISQ